MAGTALRKTIRKSIGTAQPAAAESIEEQLRLARQYALDQGMRKQTAIVDKENMPENKPLKPRRTGVKSLTEETVPVTAEEDAQLVETFPHSIISTPVKQYPPYLCHLI